MASFLKWLFMVIGILTVECSACLAIKYAFNEHDRRKKAKRKRQNKEVIPRPNFRIPPPEKGASIRKDSNKRIP